MSNEDYIREFMPNISDKGLQLVLRNATEKRFKKGEIITKQGEVPQCFYIIKSGIARGYNIDKKGKQHIKTLYLPPSTCGATTALIKEKPSKITYDCITDAIFIELNYKGIKQEVHSNLEVALLNINVLERIFVRVNERVDDLTLLDATERYLKLKEQIPNIDNLIQQYHIASYLNITPVQLSRIRKKIYSK